MGQRHSNEMHRVSAFSDTTDGKIQSSMHDSKPDSSSLDVPHDARNDTESDSSPRSLLSVPAHFKQISTSRLCQRDPTPMLVASNGVTGIYISPKICSIASSFWFENVDKLPPDQQLEVACSIYFSMLSNNAEIKQLLKANLAKQKIAAISMKFLYMFSWLIRNLMADNIDLSAVLSNLGTVHQAMGVNITHFDPMLQAMHESLAHYFETTYTIQVKYALDEIFAVAAQLMTGQDLRCGSYLSVLSSQFQQDKVPFLQSLEVCLESGIGREYLYRYLQQTWCDEMVIFLQTLARFKSSPSDKERFMIAREIVKVSVESSSDFSLNLCFQNRSETINAMQEMEQQFVDKKTLNISISFFSTVEAEVHKLINDNHWHKFVKTITNLQSQSCDAE